VRRLHAIDADLLYAETPTWHLHVGGLVILDPSTAAGGLSFEDWKEHVADRVHRAPPLRERVVDVPFGLDRPLWVADPGFDVDEHVRHVHVPAPGGRHELAAVVGDFAGRKLDRSRPLWEMWYLDELEDGRVAMLVKVHHAVADGVGAALLLASFLDTHVGAAAGSPATAGAPPPERIPSSLELFARGLGSLAVMPLRAARPLGRTVTSAGGILRLRSTMSGSPAMPFRGPRMAFNRPVTAQRSFAFTSVPLADVKAVKNACGSTVNDAVLALCAGALRSYLQAHDALPDAPLVAAVPVSTRGDDDLGAYGNRVSGLFVTLPTDRADPVERLRSSREAADEAKRLYGSGVEDTLIGWADVPPPAAMALGVRLLTWTHLSEGIPPIFNLLVSNVPGSPVPLYLGGSTVTAIHPLGPVLDDIGLNITILSHVDRIAFGLLSCPELIPDLWALADAIPEALDELVSAVG